jgi:CheY-like chemotaxis protein
MTPHPNHDGATTDQMTGRPRRVSSAAAPAYRRASLVPAVLLADPDPDARAMIRDALLEGTGPADLRTASSAEELVAYLETPDDPTTPRPSLILVDEDLADDAVRAIKSNPGLRHTPVVVLSRTLDPARTQAAYEAGANTVIAKPVTFLALVKLMKVFTAYWLEAAELPG